MLVKFRIPEIVLGILFAVAIFGMGMLFSSQPTTHQQQPQAAETAQHKTTYVSAEERIADYTYWLTLLTGVMAVATIGLLFATNRTAKIAERALTELEAPFVYVKIKSENLTHQSGRLTGALRFLFGNYGRTPAHILEFIDHHEIVGLGEGQPKAIDPATQRGTVMPYGVVAGPDGVSQDFERRFVELLAPGKVLFFLGYVRYADIFQRNYTLGFCYQFDSNGFRWVLSGGDGYNYCRPDSGPDRPPNWFHPSARSGNLSQLFIRLGMQQADRDRNNPS